MFAKRVVLIVCGVYSVLYLALYTAGRWDGNVYHMFGDFFVLWSGGRFVLAGRAAELYDWSAFHAFQVGIQGNDMPEYPVPYPPSFLPVLAVIGLLPYIWAYLVWITSTFLAMAAAVYDAKRPVGQTLALLVAPATLINTILGYNGFLSAALAVGGFRLVTTRPVLGGVLLGCLSYKPQLFLLIPVALVAARCWRALGSTLLSAALLTLLSVVLWGFTPWLSWLAFLPELSAKVDAYIDWLGPLMVTVSAGLRGLGVSREVTSVVQLLACGVALVAVWRAFRRGPGPFATATLLTATFLATPYAYTLDLTLVAAAVLLVVNTRGFERLSVFGRTVLFLAWVLPVMAISLGRWHIPTGPVVLTALLYVLDRLGAKSAQASHHVPVPAYGPLETA